MNSKRIICVLMGLLAAAMTVSGEEILVNRDFSKSVNGVPAKWEYQKHRSKPEYKLNPVRPERHDPLFRHGQIQSAGSETADLLAKPRFETRRKMDPLPVFRPDQIPAGLCAV